jgi:hypothetical protein
VSDVSSLSPQPFFRPIGVDLHLHSELLGKEGLEKEIVIPLKIFNPDSLLMQTLKLMEHGKVVHKGGKFLFGGKIFKPEEEFEKVSEDQQMSDPLFLRI